MRFKIWHRQYTTDKFVNYDIVDRQEFFKELAQTFISLTEFLKLLAGQEYIEGLKKFQIVEN